MNPETLRVGYDKASPGHDKSAMVFMRETPDGLLVIGELYGEAADYVDTLRKRLEELERELPMDVVALSVPVTIGFKAAEEEKT